MVQKNLSNFKLIISKKTISTENNFVLLCCLIYLRFDVARLCRFRFCDFKVFEQWRVDQCLMGNHDTDIGNAYSFSKITCILSHKKSIDVSTGILAGCHVTITGLHNTKPQYLF